MTLRRALAIALAASLVGACGGEDPSPTEQACAGWRNLLTEKPTPSDAAVAARLGELLELEPDEPVAGYMVAVRARLRDGADISTSFASLSRACT